jgi:hypothetical protein
VVAPTPAGRAEYSNGLSNVPGDPDAGQGAVPETGGAVSAPGLRLGAAYAWQLPPSHHQSYMLKVQTRSLGWSPWSLGV